MRPTAVLTPQEIDELFVTLRAMVAGGHSIVFISHKLHEVLSIADRVTVLRAGRVTAAGVSTVGVTKSQLATLMVGREVVFSVKKNPVKAGDTVLSVENVCAENEYAVSLRCATSASRCAPVRSLASLGLPAMGRASWLR